MPTRAYQIRIQTEAWEELVLAMKNGVPTGARPLYNEIRGREREIMRQHGFIEHKTRGGKRVWLLAEPVP
mgnify:FL=1